MIILLILLALTNIFAWAINYLFYQDNKKLDHRKRELEEAVQYWVNRALDSEKAELTKPVIRATNRSKK